MNGINKSLSALFLLISLIFSQKAFSQAPASPIDSLQRVLASTQSDTTQVNVLLEIVKQFIQDREDAEDITAEVFVKLWKLRANLNTIKNIEAFLYTTGRNACLDFLRHMQRRNLRQKDIIRNLLQQPEEGILEEDVKSLVLRTIHEEIEKLPRSCRNVFKMAYVDGRSNDEIAQELGINNQSVRNHKLRAVKLLRIALLHRNMMVGACTIIYLLNN